MKKVLIAGGSGLVGSRLTDILMDHGYEVWHLSRQGTTGNWVKSIQWDVENQDLDPSKLEGVDYVINLTGAGIADEKWTDQRLKIIRDSRVQSNLLLKNCIAQLNKKPEKFISASAVGYYGFQTSEKIFTEEDSPGNDLLASICLDWEKSADEIADLGIPTAKIRIGIILTDDGGALPRMEEPIRWGVGAALGSGKQYMPWIHIDDICNLFLHIIEKNLEGVYNGVAPNPVNNKEFTNLLAKAMDKRILLPNIPSFILRLILGSRADLILKGSRISCEKVKNSGFTFTFSRLEDALEDLYFTT